MCDLHELKAIGCAETGGANQEMKSDQLRELVDSCGKMQLLDRMLPKLQRNGHRVLIFSQVRVAEPRLQRFVAS